MYHFKHLDPVSFTHPKTGKTIFGFVYMNPEKRVDLTKIFYNHGQHFFCPMGASEKVFFDKLKCKPADVSDLPKHTRAIHERMGVRFLFKKGMCVAIRDDGDNEVYGRVVKGGPDTIKVAAGHTVYQVAAYFVDHEELPSFDSPLDLYEVTNYQIVSGHDDSEPMTAKIRAGNEVIGHASDDGWGGGIMIHRDTKASTEAFEAFENTVADVAKKAMNGAKLHSSVTDLWVHWDWYIRPTKQSFEEYMADFAQRLTSARKADNG